MIGFSAVNIVVIESPLKRRVMRFDVLDAKLVLDYDADQERPSTRHRFTAVRFWQRIQSNRKNTMDRREPPAEAIQQALEAVKAQNLRDIDKLDRDKETVSQISRRLMLQYKEACDKQQALTGR